MAFTINDRRGQEKPKEVCRVCGSKEVHTALYNKPTMKCIEYLREQNQKEFTKGKIDGIREYSWMKDGVTYVGTCGTTLKEALKEV